MSSTSSSDLTDLTSLSGSPSHPSRDISATTYTAGTQTISPSVLSLSPEPSAPKKRAKSSSNNPRKRRRTELPPYVARKKTTNRGAGRGSKKKAASAAPKSTLPIVSMPDQEVASSWPVKLEAGSVETEVRHRAFLSWESSKLISCSLLLQFVQCDA